MKVVSLNVSQAQEVSYKGKTVLTGIFKKPTTDKVMVHKDHLEGDAQGDLKVHGGVEKAVYAFSANHYDYWRQALSQPDLRFGAFGENLTITDLDEADFCIGDQLSIGECILEVSQPRVPCYKLGIALNNDKAPSLYSKHGATGIYFRVIESGFIAPDDEVKVVKKMADGVTVKSLFAAYYDRHFEDAIKVLETVICVDALADEWRAKVTKRLARASID